MTKKERIAAEIEKAKAKRQILNERIADLERRYKEEETLEMHEIVRRAKLTPEELSEIADVPDSLARSVLKHSEKSMTFSELVAEVKSKNNLYTSVSRALLHVVLDMKEKIRPEAGNLKVSYLRLLAFREEASGLLRAVSDSSSSPLVTKPADAPCRDDGLFRLDIRAAALYGGAVLAKYGVRLREDMTRGPVICR